MHVGNKCQFNNSRNNLDDLNHKVVSHLWGQKPWGPTIISKHPQYLITIVKDLHPQQGNNLLYSILYMFSSSKLFHWICSYLGKSTYLNSFICICISSQSQCGHSESGKKYHNSRQNTISYISNTGATITSEHQMALALALANTEGYISQVKIQLFLTYE